MRMTMDFHDNEIKQNAFLTDKFAEIFQAMGAKQVVKKYRKGPYDVTDYQTTHLCGGAVMGTRSEDQRAQPLSAELGCAESVRHGRQRLPAERRLQPDRHGGGAGLLVGAGDPHAVSEESRAAGACVSALRNGAAAWLLACWLLLVLMPRCRTGRPEHRTSRRSSAAAIWPSPPIAPPAIPIPREPAAFRRRPADRDAVR